jgi:nucleoside-diphosphate kinase
MAVERTLSILKPDALESGVIGKILTKLEDAGLKPVAMKMLQLTQKQAEGFYAVHRDRPFFKSLVQYMTSGPVIVQVLEAENAVAKNREVMGATNPENAAPGTIRNLFAKSI